MSRLRHYAVLAVSALGLIGLVATYPGGVGAAPQSASFSTPGSFDWIVPDGVTSVTVDAYGAAGGNGQIPEEPSEGGLGGRTRATIEVTPGETLQVNVGGLGGSYTGGGPALGGSNGGGDAGGPGAGGGGGASDVRRGGTALVDRVVVAGGGGGGGARQNVCEIADGGDGGGDAPSAGGSTNDATGGEPGGTDAGGAGGAAGSMGGAGQSGSAGMGGTGGTSMESYAAGGGGGGWFGGGGGGGSMMYSAAGGGGSAHVVDGAASVTYENGSRSGDGLVVLSWDEPAPTTPRRHPRPPRRPRPPRSRHRQHRPRPTATEAPRSPCRRAGPWRSPAAAGRRAARSPRPCTPTRWCSGRSSPARTARS